MSSHEIGSPGKGVKAEEDIGDFKKKHSKIEVGDSELPRRSGRPMDIKKRTYVSNPQLRRVHLELSNLHPRDLRQSLIQRRPRCSIRRFCLIAQTHMHSNDKHRLMRKELDPREI